MTLDILMELRLVLKLTEMILAKSFRYRMASK